MFGRNFIYNVDELRKKLDVLWILKQGHSFYLLRYTTVYTVANLNIHASGHVDDIF